MARRRIAQSGTLVLDSEGLAKLAAHDVRSWAFLKAAEGRGARVVVSAVTLTEVLRGDSRDVTVFHVLSRVVVLPVTEAISRQAGELLGSTGLPGHRCAVDAIVAVTALQQSRPVMLLTSDPDDMHRLVEEPEVPKPERVAVHHV